MLQDKRNQYFIELADMLTGHKVDSGAVEKSLEFLCQTFGFQCGMVYEAEFVNQFCLMEHYTSCPVEFQKFFSTEKLTDQELEYLISKELIFIDKNENNTPVEKGMLQAYQASAIAVASVADGDNLIYGFIVMVDLDSGMVFKNEDLGMLSACLSMASRYVGMRMYQKKIKQSFATLENILDNMGIDIYVNDFYTHEVLYANKSMALPYGGKESFEGRVCFEVLFPGQEEPCSFCPQSKLLSDKGEPEKVYSWDYQRPFDGSWFRVFSAAFYWVDGRLAHVVSSADITDNKRNEAIIENMANYDQLTGLPNRRSLLRECESRIDKATETEKGYLLFFDIDGFKAINDRLGHDAGDEFLIKLAEFFASIPLLKDSIFRNGGDEFVAVIGGENITKEHIRNLSRFIQERFKKPWLLKNGGVFCGTSIGVACFPEDGGTGETLLQKADMAMYHVKKNGGGGICFGYQLEEETQLAKPLQKLS